MKVIVCSLPRSAIASGLLCLLAFPFAVTGETAVTSKGVRQALGVERARYHLTASDNPEVKHGYALLYALASDETQVDQVFLIKKGSPQLRDAMAQIAKAAKELQKDLEALRENDRATPFGPNGLPEIEVATRKMIRGEKQKRIVLGKAGEFERELLLSQCEGLTYGMSLLQTLADQDEQPSRQKMLRRHAETWRSLRQQIVGMVRATDGV